MTGLKKLFMPSCIFENDHLYFISNLSNLQVLDVSKSWQVNDEALEFFTGIKSLKCVNIYGCPLVSPVLPLKEFHIDYLKKF